MSANGMGDVTDTSNYPNNLVELMKNTSGDAENEIKRFGGLQQIIQNLKTSTRKGIIAVSKSLQERTNKYGANQLTEREVKKGFGHYLLYSMADPVLIILVIGAIISVVLGILYPEICQGKTIVNSENNAWQEGVGILVTVVVIILLTAFSDFYRNSHWYKLQTNIENERKVTVIRSGITQQIGYRDLKVGDLVVLETGSVVPADGILVENTEVITDETSLKQRDRVIKSMKDPFVFTSTHVIVGQGKMIVLAVGERTRAGKLARDNKHERRRHDLEAAGQSLQGKLTLASSILGIMGIIVGVIVALVILISFLVKTYEIDALKYDPSHWNDIIKAIIIGIVIIIVAEPEGLSMAGTITMISSLGSMQKRNIFIRDPDMLEAMGNVTSVCVKKYGVLTAISKFVMREEVVESYINDEYFRGDANDYKEKIPANLANELASGVAINTSYSSHFQYTDNTPTVTGDITEGALLEFVDDLDFSYRLIRRKYPEDTVCKVFPFDPSRKYMTTVVKSDAKSFKLYTKGAPKVILQRCNSILTSEGQKVLEKERKDRLTEVVSAMEQRSQLKVICLASKIREEPTNVTEWDRIQEEDDYTLVAVMGIESTMGQQSSETRMTVTAGRLITKNQFGFGNSQLPQYILVANPILLNDVCRGIAVNTSYLSDIQNEGDDMLPLHNGDPRDCALLQFILDIGKAYQHYRDEYPHQKHVEYKSSASDPESEKYTATVVKIPSDNTYRVYVKGGIGFLLARSKAIIQNHTHADKVAMDDIQKKKIWDECKGLQDRDMSIIAFARKDIPIPENGSPDWSNRNEILSDLDFIGYLGLKEETRGEVIKTISTFREAGMNVSLVTGGSIQSSGAFAKKCGILTPTSNWPTNQESVFGQDYKVFAKEAINEAGQINQSKFDHLWRNNELRVMASCPPDKSPVIIRGIKQSHVRPSGEMVAAVASGIHDGPFLKEADVGISLGVSGANVAQESSGIILKQDNIQGLLETIKYGRHIYETVLKFLQFQLTATWVTLIVMIIGAILFQKSLFSATQLLWLNLIMDVLASIALTSDQPTDEILRHRPYGRDKPLISRAVLRNVIFHSIYQIAVIFILIYVFADYTDTRFGYDSKSICQPSQHATMVFTTFILMQLFNEVNCRRVQDRNVFITKGEGFNFIFFIILMLCFAIQIFMVFYFFNAFRVREMDAEQWLWCWFFGFSELLWGQIIFTIPKNIIPREIRCCSKGVPLDRGCCVCIRGGVRSRDEVDAPTEFFGIGSQPTSRPGSRTNAVNPNLHPYV